VISSFLPPIIYGQPHTANMTVQTNVGRPVINNFIAPTVVGRPTDNNLIGPTTIWAGAKANNDSIGNIYQAYSLLPPLSLSIDPLALQTKI